MKLMIYIIIALTLVACVYVEKCTEKHFYKEVENVDKSVEKEKAE